MTAPRLVLLVDDDQDLLMVLSATLKQRGYDVGVAQDAVAAMGAAVKLRPQVVVLDVGLPGGEATVVMKRMHALPQLAGVPVVMMSGRDPEKYRTEALAEGASAYLTNRSSRTPWSWRCAWPWEKKWGRLRKRPRAQPAAAASATSSRTWAL